PEGVGDLALRLGFAVNRSFRWQKGAPTALQKALFPNAARVVVAPPQPRRLLLHAACLAGAMQAPLVIVPSRKGEADRLQCRLTDWRTEEVLAVGGACRIAQRISGVKVVRLADEPAVFAAYLREQSKQGPLRALVVANPSDSSSGKVGMSALAPWVAVQRRAAL